MRPRSQLMTADGFDINVAEKMPKSKKLEQSIPVLEEVFRQPEENCQPDDAVESHVHQTQSELFEESPRQEMETGQGVDVLNLIEDLHAQLLTSSQTKRALEIDMVSYKKTIQQMDLDNQVLRHQLETLKKEHFMLKELQSESHYLQEENADALEKIKELQQDLREIRESFAKITEEKEEALNRIHDLETQLGQSEVFKMKGRLKEREASLFSEENRDLHSKLEETLNRNVELEGKYETLKKSFNEVKDSLAFLRDSCKTNYYHLQENLD